ncbi:hypothetical protein [Streptomyces sp. PvR018]|uniref:hypothetical protein n=1 Tax=Streptomyces sp. PvR018 TaxID=3156442 RepID=UPI00339370E3
MSGVIIDEGGRVHSLADLLDLIHSQKELRSHAEPDPHDRRASDDWFISDGHEFRTRYFS